MARWQKRARLGVGLFGVAFAIVVYAAIGERRTTAPVERPARLDPRAVLESAGAAFQQFREAKQDFVVEAERQLTYEDGSTKFFGATITVRNRGGRDFTVSGREGQAGENEEELEIVGAVKLQASDGFTVTAERATFNKSDATVRVPGAVSFHKGGMSGSGSRMTYNQSADVLVIDENARVVVVDEAGKTQTQFTAGAARLDRRERYLALEGDVHALREEQVLEADRGVARLTEDGERITFIELRGNAQVIGGNAFDSMRARDIDLDYTDDGATLEAVALRGGGVVATTGSADGGEGRRFAGESLDLALAPDASLTAVTGRGRVRIDMPAGRGMPGRLVTAEELDASGEAGKGLTSALFTNDVEYREDGSAAQPARVARSTVLRLALADDAVVNALFTGSTRFQDETLQGSGARADYDPSGGTLRLSGTDAGGGPRVASADIQIEAESIDVTLDGPRMLAKGAVKTLLQHPQAAAKPGSTTTARTGKEDRLPSLFQQGVAVNVNANTLDYQDAAGKAVYTGSAALWQGETAIRGDVLTLDRTRGDLVASGAARSNIVMDTGVSVGRAAEIRYNDADRRITYETPPAPPPAPAGRGAGAGPARPAAPPAQVSGAEGDLRAARIELVLAATESRLDRLEAYTDVNVRLDTRVATGDRLTYHADAGQYVMTGRATVPVRIVEECRETRGRTVTFFRSADRVIVDGNEEARTQSNRRGPCPPSATP